MRAIFAILLPGIALAQLPQATGDEFTIAVYNDIHTDNDPQSWKNSVDWLVGANGRGPGGVPAVAYWNIKAIAGVGDYVTVCNDTNWNTFLAEWSRISALALPGIWPQGNHDLCPQYGQSFGSTLQNATLDVNTSLGMLRLGLLGVGTADDMSPGQPSRTWADSIIASSSPERQWMFLRHVGTYAAYAAPGPYQYPANGDSGWCANTSQCAGYGNAGVALRDTFYAREPRVFWGVHGHNGYVAMDSLTADDGHPVQVTGNLGASGGTAGWITLLKFRPAQKDIQVAVYLSQTGTQGSIYSGPYTWTWTPQPVVTSTPATGTAAFIKTDTATQGTWKGAYGAEGYNVINDSANYPAYVTVTPAGFLSYTWSASTTDPRAMQKASVNDRVAACWYSPDPFTVDLSFKDANTHQVAFYLLDWDNFNGGRNERIDILDANNTVLDTWTVSSFVGGQYVVWNLSGHVIVRIANMNGVSNSVLSGILFGTSTVPSDTAVFVKLDSTTQGTWKGSYGAEGYNVVNESPSYPSYVSVTPAGGFLSYTWSPSTIDPRALQRASINDRIAACWYSSSPFTIDLSFKDASTHQVALYLLDWDNFNGGRNERIDILNANNTLLDTRTVSSFVGGQYAVWNLSGHVVVRITNMNIVSNSVLSGIFFR